VGSDADGDDELALDGAALADEVALGEDVVWDGVGRAVGVCRDGGARKIYWKGNIRRGRAHDEKDRRAPFSMKRRGEWTAKHARWRVGGAKVVVVDGCGAAHATFHFWTTCPSKKKPSKKKVLSYRVAHLRMSIA
jgi:hypothetical protein